MKIEILGGAEEDLVDGFEFYEKQEKGLGHYFLSTLFREMDELDQTAGIHARHFGCHRMLSRTFPYAVYYHVGKDAVLIAAVLDCRRNPRWIRNRLNRPLG